MMRPYVCHQCRLQLPRRLAPPRHPQLLSRRTIVSFRKTYAPPQSSTDAQQPAEDASNAGNGQYTQGGQRDNTPTGRYSRPAQYQQEQYPGRERAPAADANTTKPVAQNMHFFLEKGNLKAAWDLLNEAYTSRDVPALTAPALSDIPHLMGGKLFTRLAGRIADEFHPGKTHLPTPTQVLFRYEQLGIAPAKIWNRTISLLTSRLLSSMAPDRERQPPPGTVSTASSDTPSASDTVDTSSASDTEAILAELLSVWKLFFQRHGTRPGIDPLESISPDWMLPEVNGETARSAVSRDLGARLGRFHQSHASSPELEFSAVTIFNYFFGETQPPRAIPNSLREPNRPFLDLLVHTLADARIGGAFRNLEYDTRMKDLDEDFRKSIVAQMDRVPDRARIAAGLDDASITPEERASQVEEKYVHRISNMVMMQANYQRVVNLWTEAEKYYTSAEGKPQIPRSVYNAFLSGFMVLLAPQKTMEVWNHMATSGMTPDLSTWNAMLFGCARAKDLDGLAGIWQRMLRAGVEPDEHAWTTRIHTLIITLNVNDGLAALDEMGKRFLAAEKIARTKKGAKNNLTKPGIGVINGALTGIIIGIPTRGKVVSNRRKGMAWDKKVDFVRNILQWAGHFHIKPETRTYNALISLYLDGEDYPTAFKLLRQMEKEGLEGDLATHTMLIRAAFDNQKFDTFSPQGQADHLIGLFRQLTEGGLKPNQYVYQIAIDRLLKHYSNALGVRIIIEHMMQNRMSISPQIYTSLVTHYFQQDPPAIREVDSLVTRLFGPPAQATDRFLFDRIVEGYAKAGEIASMMTVLTKMSSHGKKPTYRSLGEVVKALYNAGEWDRARSVVRDVLHGEGLAEGGAMYFFKVGRTDFLGLVERQMPELLEDLAGDHLKTPVRGGIDLDGLGAAAAQGGQVAPDMRDGAAGYGQQEAHEQTHAPYVQQQYEQQQDFQQYPHQHQHQQQVQGQEYYQQQSYDQGGYEQAPYGSPPQYEQTGHDQPPYQQDPYNQTQYQQDPYNQTSYPDASYQQSPYSYQPQPGDEFVNAEHAGYLSDESEPQAPPPPPQQQQQWKAPRS